MRYLAPCSLLTVIQLRKVVPLADWLESLWPTDPVSVENIARR